MRGQQWVFSFLFFPRTQAGRCHPTSRGARAVPVPSEPADSALKCAFVPKDTEDRVDDSSSKEPEEEGRTTPLLWRSGARPSRPVLELLNFKMRNALVKRKVRGIPGAPTGEAGLSPRSLGVGLTQGPSPWLLGSYSPGGADRRSRGALR